MRRGRMTRKSIGWWHCAHILCPALLLTGCFFEKSGEIQQQISKVKKELAALPLESLNLAPWTLGYRSRGQDTPESDIEIDIPFESPAAIDLVAIMPATYTEDGQTLKAYCFPRRFTIEYLRPNGSYTILADLSHEDYDIQGVEPQIFSLPEAVTASGLRIRVTRLSENLTWAYGNYFLALGEVMVFSGNWNVALNRKVTTNSRDNYSYIWTPWAMVDGFSLFSPIDRYPQNPNTTPMRVSNVDSAVICYDLGQICKLDEYRFWPLVHGMQFNHPPSSGIGFPRGIHIEISMRPDFEDAKPVFQSEEVYPDPGSSPLMIRTPPQSGRYVRMRLDNIVRDFRTQTVEIALDEIQLLSRGEVLSSGLMPSFVNFRSSQQDLIALTDGRTSEGIILPLRQWLVDFSLRAQLARKLDRLTHDREIMLLRENERATFVIITIAAISIALALMVLLVYLLSERHWNSVRERIACDLHDDLGANMISVAHSLELIQHSQSADPEKCSQLLRDATSTAFRTAEETRQIVRLLQKDENGTTWTETIRQTVKQLLGDIDYTLEFEEVRAFNQLSHHRRWNLTLFIKEALNNISKHSGAKCASLRFLRKDKKLVVLINDDGRGIKDDPTNIRHLEQRTRMLKGRLQVTSKPGQGTQIRLEI